MIVTVASQKGGVGKTTAAAVGHGLTRRGKWVRLVDFDPQGHLSLTLGLDPEPGVFDYLVGERPLVEVARQTTRCGLSLLPGNSRTRTTETVLRAEATLATVATQVRGLGAGVDVVVIDTPPSGWLQEAAVASADVLIVPARLEALGVDGVARTLEMAALFRCGYSSSYSPVLSL